LPGLRLLQEQQQSDAEHQQPEAQAALGQLAQQRQSDAEFAPWPDQPSQDAVRQRAPERRAMSEV
jgi:hypothetical protein